jgi:hypothetical protein
VDGGRLIGLAALRLRREVRSVGLDQQALRRDACCRLGKRRVLRIRHVAGERDPPACGDAVLETLRHREAVQDDPDACGTLAQQRERVLGGVASVDDERLVELLRQGDLELERPHLRFARRAVAVVVQPRLANRHTARMGRVAT